MSATTKNLLTALATAAFAIAATATTVTNAFAQTTAAPATANTVVAGSAVKNAVANGALAAAKTEQPAGLTRAQVRAEYLEARKNGTLMETEVDFDVAQTRKQFAK
jgi:malate synthase